MKPNYFVFRAACLAFTIACSPPAHGAEAGSVANDERAEQSAAPSTDAAPPEHHAADASAPEVTEANLLANERFWPYMVELTQRWQGKGVVGELPAGTRGILIRVEESGRARIDFGRNGLADVPPKVTDLVARSNGVRRGTVPKPLPNFVEAIGPRLLGSGAQPRPLPMSTVYARPGFLCVFADPSSPSFADLAKAIAPLQDRAGVMTILFPQGRPPDAAVYEKLRSLDWKIPFVFQHLSEPYTRSLAGEKLELPYVTLQTSEGRLLMGKKWSPELPTELGSAIDAKFGDAAERVASGEVLAKKR